MQQSGMNKEDSSGDRISDNTDHSQHIGKNLKGKEKVDVCRRQVYGFNNEDINFLLQHSQKHCKSPRLIDYYSKKRLSVEAEVLDKLLGAPERTQINSELIDRLLLDIPKKYIKYQGLKDNKVPITDLLPIPKYRQTYKQGNSGASNQTLLNDFIEIREKNELPQTEIRKKIELLWKFVVTQINQKSLFGFTQQMARCFFELTGNISVNFANLPNSGIYLIITKYPNKLYIREFITVQLLKLNSLGPLDNIVFNWDGELKNYIIFEFEHLVDASKKNRVNASPNMSYMHFCSNNKNTTYLMYELWHRWGKLRDREARLQLTIPNLRLFMPKDKNVKNYLESNLMRYNPEKLDKSAYETNTINKIASNLFKLPNKTILYNDADENYLYKIPPFVPEKYLSTSELEECITIDTSKISYLLFDKNPQLWKFMIAADGYTKISDMCKKIAINFFKNLSGITAKLDSEHTGIYFLFTQNPNILIVRQTTCIKSLHGNPDKHHGLYGVIYDKSEKPQTYITFVLEHTITVNNNYVTAKITKSQSCFFSVDDPGTKEIIFGAWRSLNRRNGHEKIYKFNLPNNLALLTNKISYYLRYAENKAPTEFSKDYLVFLSKLDFTREQAVLDIGRNLWELPPSDNVVDHNYTISQEKLFKKRFSQTIKASIHESLRKEFKNRNINQLLYFFLTAKWNQMDMNGLCGFALSEFFSIVGNILAGSHNNSGSHIIFQDQQNCMTIRQINYVSQLVLEDATKYYERNSDKDKADEIYMILEHIILVSDNSVVTAQPKTLELHVNCTNESRAARLIKHLWQTWEELLLSIDKRKPLFNSKLENLNENLVHRICRHMPLNKYSLGKLQRAFPVTYWIPTITKDLSYSLTEFSKLKYLDVSYSDCQAIGGGEEYNKKLHIVDTPPQKKPQLMIFANHCAKLKLIPFIDTHNITFLDVSFSKGPIDKIEFGVRNSINIAIFIKLNTIFSAIYDFNSGRFFLNKAIIDLVYDSETQLPKYVQDILNEVALGNKYYTKTQFIVKTTLPNINKSKFKYIRRYSELIDKIYEKFFDHECNYHVKKIARTYAENLNQILKQNSTWFKHINTKSLQNITIKSSNMLLYYRYILYKLVTIRNLLTDATYDCPFDFYITKDYLKTILRKIPDIEIDEAEITDVFRRLILHQILKNKQLINNLTDFNKLHNQIKNITESVSLPINFVVKYKRLTTQLKKIRCLFQVHISPTYPKPFGEEKLYFEVKNQFFYYFGNKNTIVIGINSNTNIMTLKYAVLQAFSLGWFSLSIKPKTPKGYILTDANQHLLQNIKTFYANCLFVLEHLLKTKLRYNEQSNSTQTDELDTIDYSGFHSTQTKFFDSPRKEQARKLMIQTGLLECTDAVSPKTERCLLQ